MNSSDIVIIGGGPAGLEAAKTLANSKYSVVLVDKGQKNKICAGGISDKCFQFFPKKITNKKFYSIKSYCENFYFKLNLENPLYILEREDLYDYYLKKLKKSNNISILNEKVEKINEKYISTKNKKIKYDYLIGADGSNSLVRKYLRIPSKRIFVALQYKTFKKFSELEVIFNYNLFPSGYSWIFPHKNYTAIGCAANLKNSKNLKKKFDKWLKNRKINIKPKIESHIINTDYRGYKFGNIFLIGDAAGLVSPFSGEGIYPALVSGREIAKKILDENYNPYIKNILKIQKIHNLNLILFKYKIIRRTLFNLGNILFKNNYFRKKFIKYIV